MHSSGAIMLKLTATEMLYRSGEIYEVDQSD